MTKKKPQNKTAPKNQKEWTIMVYMAGDNNLAVDMAYNLEQIREVAKQGADKLNLFVYYDGHSSQIPTLYCDFSDPDQPIYLPSYSVPNKLFPVPEHWSENAASQYSVVNFVDWCVNKRGGRAERYAMIFSGHSLGFADKGLFRDETSGESMKITDLFMALQRIVMSAETLNDFVETNESREKEILREDPDAVFEVSEEAIEVLLDKTALLLGQPIDILGFDSCLMGMFEVGYQFKDIAETMIVSEGSVPSAGWSYAKILASLTSGARKRPTKKVAANFVKEFIRSQDNYIVGGVSVDMAAWDMSKFSDLADYVSLLSLILQSCFRQAETSPTYKQMERIILSAHWKCQSYMFDQNVDLGDFCGLLIKECNSVLSEFGDSDETLTYYLKEVAGGSQNVLAALKKAVILSGFSGGEYQYSNGVSLFFPWSLEAYEATRENYAGTWYSRDNAEGGELYGNGSWDYFLQEYLQNVARRSAASPTAKLFSKSNSMKLIRLKQANPDSRYVYSSGVNFYQEPNLQLLQGGEASETKGGGGTISGSSKGGGGTTSGSSKGGGGTTSGSSKGGAGTTSGSSKGGGGTTSGSSKGGAGTTSGSSKGGGGTTSGSSKGGGTDTFYETLKLRKNIEVNWNISGFTKKLAEEEEPES